MSSGGSLFRCTCPRCHTPTFSVEGEELVIIGRHWNDKHESRYSLREIFNAVYSSTFAVGEAASVAYMVGSSVVTTPIAPGSFLVPA